jgi:cytochrome b561
MSDSSHSLVYTRTAIALHWLVAALIFLNIVIGFYMEGFAKNTPERNDVMFYHASFGSLIFILALARLVWRLTHPAPALPSTLPRWQATVSHWVHRILYALMLMIPFVGYVHRLAGDHAVNFFGLGELPVFIDKDEPLRILTDTLHVASVWVLITLLALHLVATLKHRLIDRDGVIERMLRF